MNFSNKKRKEKISFDLACYSLSGTFEPCSKSAFYSSYRKGSLDLDRKANLVAKTGRENFTGDLGTEKPNFWSNHGSNHT